jgi:hypothetical protein
MKKERVKPGPESIKCDATTLQQLKSLKGKLQMKSMNALMLFLADHYVAMTVVVRSSEVAALRDEIRDKFDRVEQMFAEEKAALQRLIVNPINVSVIRGVSK